MTILAILLAAFLCYLPVMEGEFLFDDWFLVHDSVVRNGDWRGALYRIRGLAWATFCVNRRWCKGTPDEIVRTQMPRAVHLTNIFIHGFTAVLVSLLAEHWMSGWGWMAGLAFAVHPLASGACAYATGRSTVLAGFFVVLSLYLGVCVHPLLALLPLPLAVYSKEDASASLVTLSLLLPRWSPVFLAVLGCGLWKYRGRIRRFIVNGTEKSGWTEYGFPPMKTSDYRKTFVAEHVFRMLGWIPGVWFNPDPDVREVSNLRFIAALVVGILLALVIGTVSLPALILLTATPLALYFIVENPDLVFEYRAYLCTVGIALLWAKVSANIPIPIITGVLVFWMGMTMYRCYRWSDWIAFWEEVTVKSPLKMRGWINLGMAWRVKGNWALAEKYALRARDVAPQSAMPLEHLAWLADREKDLPKTKALLEEAARLSPRSFIAWLSLGNIEEAMGQHATAESCYRRSLEVNPNYDQALFRLGKLLTSKVDGRIEAVTHLRRAVKIEPQAEVYQQMLAVACHLVGEDPGPSCSFRVTGVEEVPA